MADVGVRDGDEAAGEGVEPDGEGGDPHAAADRDAEDEGEDAPAADQVAWLGVGRG